MNSLRGYSWWAPGVIFNLVGLDCPDVRCNARGTAGYDLQLGIGLTRYFQRTVAWHVAARLGAARLGAARRSAAAPPRRKNSARPSGK